MAAEVSFLLTNLSEAQRTHALLHPALEGHTSQTQLARKQLIPLSTIQR